MSILRAIDEHIIRFERITGQFDRPMDTTIYLGQVQWEAFKVAATSLCDFQIVDDADDLHRVQYNGRRVYRVDTKNHLAVGFSCLPNYMKTRTF